MKTSKFTGEQIACALRQAEVGTPVAEVCRKMGVSEATTTAGSSYTAASQAAFVNVANGVLHATSQYLRESGTLRCDLRPPSHILRVADHP